MKTTLRKKIILVNLTVAIIAVLVVALIIWLNGMQSFSAFIMRQKTDEIKQDIQTFYAENGTLTDFPSVYHPRHGTLQNGKEVRMRSAGSGYSNIRGIRGLVDGEGRFLTEIDGYMQGDLAPKEVLENATRVETDGQVIAWIIPEHRLIQLSIEESNYLRKTTIAIFAALAFGVIIAILAGIFLSNQLTKPIRRLTLASKALSKGELGLSIPVSSTDEIGELTATFNQMSTELALNDVRRKRLTVDIAHDLGSPLQVISGYLEMFSEGIIEPSPGRFQAIESEVERLRRLTNDLSTLSQIDTKRLEIQNAPMQPVKAIKKAFSIWEPIAGKQGIGIQLQISSSGETAWINADEGRFDQVLQNLIENALRATPKEGLITLSLEKSENDVEISVSDTGVGIAANDLPFLFDRFFRSDPTRDPNAGKMGLGLAISKSLITAQGGKIHAKSAGVGQGAKFVLRFPIHPMQLV